MKNIENQYKDSTNLDIRIEIHQKYSVNKLGFVDFLCENYGDLANLNVLDIGCGTGDIWKNKDTESIKKLVLTDFSKGMLEKAKENIRGNNVAFEVCDIQNLPYEDNSFDVVIANMMLYHVPDLNKGLAEVKRVLKDGGKFFCATYGINGVSGFVCRMLNVKEELNQSFVLQNGYGILKSYFNKVEKLEYKDELKVTSIDDMVNYILSLSDLYDITDIDVAKLRAKLVNEMIDGVISIPKEYGTFVCVK